jgi:hypothetical protein
MKASLLKHLHAEAGQVEMEQVEQLFLSSLSARMREVVHTSHYVPKALAHKSRYLAKQGLQVEQKTGWRLLVERKNCNPKWVERRSCFAWVAAANATLVRLGLPCMLGKLHFSGGPQIELHLLVRGLSLQRVPPYSALQHGWLLLVHLSPVQ